MRNISDDFGQVGNVFCLDMETELAPKCFEGRDQVRLLQIYSPKYEFWYDLQTFTDAEWDELKQCLESPDLTIIGHNIIFDIRCLQGCGIDPKNAKLEDTMFQSWLLKNGIPTAKYDLKTVVKEQLGIEISKELQAQKWMTADLSIPENPEYAMNDVRMTWRCWKSMNPQVTEAGLDIPYQIEMLVSRVTIQMEATGIFLNREKIDQQMIDLDETRKTSLAAFVEELDADLQDAGTEGLPKNADGSINLNRKTTGSVRLGTKRYAGFNPGSSKQLLEVFKTIGVEPTNPEGKPSVNKDFLAKYSANSVVKTYLGWKKVDKHLQMAHTLIKAQHEDGRIYARFNQRGTFTGRYSSSTPNLQNVPKGDMRYCFSTIPGRELVDLDVRGMELVALCSPKVANETRMAEAFNKGVDVHRHTASLMFDVAAEDVTDEQRFSAKAVNFGAAYGSSAGGLVNFFHSMGMMISLEEGQKFLTAWLAAYPAISRWHDIAREVSKAEGVVRMVDGRRRYLIGDAARHTIYCNNLVQGSCASTMKLAMYGIWKELPDIDPTARIIAQIHDEVLIECNKGLGEGVLTMAKDKVREAGKDIFGPSVAFECDGRVADSWGDAH